jgi:hypothetical protein
MIGTPIEPRAVGDTTSASINQRDPPMSADKDRGIRREKQKRAKVLKKESRQQRQEAASQGSAAKKSAQK